MDSTWWPAQTAWMMRREREMAESEPLHITRSEKGWLNKSGEWAQTKFQVNTKKMKTRRRTWSWAWWRGGLWTIRPRNRTRGHSTYGATIIPRTSLPYSHASVPGHALHPIIATLSNLFLFKGPQTSDPFQHLIHPALLEHTWNFTCIDHIARHYFKCRV